MPITDGAICSRVDLNGDKRPDVVALFAQEHETVVAFINKGPRIACEPHTIYTAPQANWGSSGIQVADPVPLEDVITRPLPALVWLEQRNPGRFARHTLKQGMAYHATLDLADFDRDGDVDIVIGHMPTTGSDSAWIEIWENRGDGT